MTTFKEFCPKDAKDWHNWIKKNHDKGQGVWLVHNKKGTENYNLSYEEALDCALCYGWIDSTLKPKDDKQYWRYFSKRNKNSVWSRVNKNKIEKLIASGRMTEHGYACIEAAKKNGSYYILESVEAGIAPPELQKALDKNKKAKKIFEALAIKDRGYFLYRLAMLKTEAAREREVERVVSELLGLKS